MPCAIYSFVSRAPCWMARSPASEPSKGRGWGGRGVLRGPRKQGGGCPPGLPRPGRTIHPLLACVGHCTGSRRLDALHPENSWSALPLPPSPICLIFITVHFVFRCHICSFLSPVCSQCGRSHQQVFPSRLFLWLSATPCHSTWQPGNPEARRNVYYYIGMDDTPMHMA